MSEEWSAYAHCTKPGCNAYAGEPCVDTRYWPPGTYRKPIKKTAHKERTRSS